MQLEFNELTPKFIIKKDIRLIELFAGVGSQAMALKEIGANFESWYVCEIDKYALASYNAIHKSSHNGQFNYGKNFYAKDADMLYIQLPTKDNSPDYDYMELFISAIKKLVIKDVVLYADNKIKATKEVIKKHI